MCPLFGCSTCILYSSTFTIKLKGLEGGFLTIHRPISKESVRKGFILCVVAFGPDSGGYENMGEQNES